MNAFYNGYKRSGLAKVHIERTIPVRRQVRSWRDETFPQAWCGVSATNHANSPKIPVDPVKSLEPGLSWCGHCLGRAVEHAGLLVEVAAMLAVRAVGDRIRSGGAQ